MSNRSKWLDRSNKSLKNYVLVVATVVITVLVSILIFKPQCPQYKLELNTSGYLCAPSGTHPSVARQRGCECDWMSFHWLPKDRFGDENRALIREFEELGPWHRFADAEGTQIMSPNETMLSIRFLAYEREIPSPPSVFPSAGLPLYGPWPGPALQLYTPHPLSTDLDRRYRRKSPSEHGCANHQSYSVSGASRDRKWLQTTHRKSPFY